MSDITELEQRITAALDRIGGCLDGLAAADWGKLDKAEIAKLREALDAEKTANSQLEERVVSIKDKQVTLVETLEGEVAKLRDDYGRHSAEVQNLKRVNAKLRKNNRALREANTQGVGDTGVINSGRDAELDALRVSRDSDRAELDAILVELTPLVEGGANA